MHNSAAMQRLFFMPGRAMSNESKVQALIETAKAAPAVRREPGVLAGRVIGVLQGIIAAQTDVAAGVVNGFQFQTTSGLVT